MREDMPYRLTNENDIASPALIYYPDIIRENTRLAVDMAGGAARLWPHVKSHKMAELIDMQMDMGVTRFKCATISEMALTCSRESALKTTTSSMRFKSSGRMMRLSSSMALDLMSL